MATKRVVGCKSIFQDFNTVFFLVRAGRASHSELFKKNVAENVCLFSSLLCCHLAGQEELLGFQNSLTQMGVIDRKYRGNYSFLKVKNVEIFI